MDKWIEELVGMSINSAIDFAKENEHQIRVIKEDGKGYPIHLDYRPSRINVEVENKTITKVVDKG